VQPKCPRRERRHQGRLCSARKPVFPVRQSSEAENLSQKQATPKQQEASMSRTRIGFKYMFPPSKRGHTHNLNIRTRAPRNLQPFLSIRESKCASRRSSSHQVEEASDSSALFRAADKTVENGCDSCGTNVHNHFSPRPQAAIRGEKLSALVCARPTLIARLLGLCTWFWIQPCRFPNPSSVPVSYALTHRFAFLLLKICLQFDCAYRKLRPIFQR
jgi:hypothetical protein